MKRSKLINLVQEVLKETIRKVGDKYVVYPKEGGKRLGTHNTRRAAEKQLTAIHISQKKENLDPSYKHDGKAAPYGSGYRPVREDVHEPMNPGILKKRLGRLSCNKVRKERAKLKDKGTTYAKALQRYLNYHCN